MSVAAQVDITGYLANPSFEAGTLTTGSNRVNVPVGYTVSHNLSGWLDCGVFTNHPTDGANCYNIWAETVNSFDMYQTVTLPQGKYTLCADVWTDVVKDQCVYAKVSSSVFESQQTPQNASITRLTADFVVQAERAEVRLGTKASAWYQIDNFRLYYNGPCLVGDANADGRVSVSDVASLVSAVNSAASTSRLADVDEAVDILLGKSAASLPLVSGLVSAEQLNSENASGPASLVTISSGVTQEELAGAFTSLNIRVLNIADISSVSVYAKGKEKIAGWLDGYNLKTKTYSVSSGYVDNPYALSMACDVVTVRNDNNSSDFTAYLLPVALKDGVTVVVRTNADVYYTQDFSVEANGVNSLTFTSTTPSGAWMATVPGDIHFTFLSIPGAHDAATSGCTSMTTWTKCQSKTIPQLLAAGVRSLDLRPYGGSGITLDKMYINHGNYSTNVLFKTALTDVRDYLSANPTETVFILLHDEKGDNAADWKKAVLEGLNLVKDYVKVIDNNMTLDDCRGKMVVITRDNVGSSTLLGKCGWGGSFGDKTVFYGQDSGDVTPWTLVYQDNYEVTNTTNRLTDIEKMLNDYVKPNATNKNRIYINTTNIAGISAIYSYAKTMNAAVVNSASFTSYDGRYGIVSSDFVADANYNGDQLLRLIIDQNYKYVYKGRTRVK